MHNGPVGFALMLTLGVTDAFTVIVIAFDGADDGLVAGGLQRIADRTLVVEIRRPLQGVEDHLEE